MAPTSVQRRALSKCVVDGICLRATISQQQNVSYLAFDFKDRNKGYGYF